MGGVGISSFYYYNLLTNKHRKTKRRNFYVIYTNKRPIPLEHYIYCLGSTYKVVDKDGKFLDSG